MAEFMDRYEECVEQMQDHAKSMEKTIRQHQDKPERVCRENSLKILIKKTQTLLEEMGDCQNGMDELTQDLIEEKTENEREIRNCNAKIDQANEDINYRNDAILDKNREISESEELVSSLERALKQGQQANENREEAMEVTKGLTIGTYIGGAALAVGGVFMPLLWIPAAAALSTSVGTAIAHKSYKDQGEVDVNEIRNRLQNQRREKERLEEKNESLRRDLINDQRKIKDLSKKLDVCEDSIGDYRKSIAAMAFCKKILTEWLLFLQDLEQSMDRVDSYGSSYATIKDTSAFRDYLTFIEGTQANQILDTSTKIQALEYMDEYELNQMIMWHENYSSDVEDTSNFNYTDSSDDDEDHYDSISVEETDSSDSASHCDSSNDEDECNKTSDSDGSTDSEDNENDCNNENDTDDFDNSVDSEDYDENNDSDDEFY